MNKKVIADQAEINNEIELLIEDLRSFQDSEKLYNILVENLDISSKITITKILLQKAEAEESQSQLEKFIYSQLIIEEGKVILARLAEGSDYQVINFPDSNLISNIITGIEETQNPFKYRQGLETLCICLIKTTILPNVHFANLMLEVTLLDPKLLNIVYKYIPNIKSYLPDQQAGKDTGKPNIVKSSNRSNAPQFKKANSPREAIESFINKLSKKDMSEGDITRLLQNYIDNGFVLYGQNVPLTDLAKKMGNSGGYSRNPLCFGLIQLFILLEKEHEKYFPQLLAGTQDSRVAVLDWLRSLLDDFSSLENLAQRTQIYTSILKSKNEKDHNFILALITKQYHENDKNFPISIFSFMRAIIKTRKFNKWIGKLAEAVKADNFLEKGNSNYFTYKNAQNPIYAFFTLRDDNIEAYLKACMEVIIKQGNSSPQFTNISLWCSNLMLEDKELFKQMFSEITDSFDKEDWPKLEEFLKMVR